MSAGTVYEIFFQKRDIRYFFPILSNFFPSSEKFRQSCEKHAIYVSVEVFGEKQFLKYT